MKKRKIHKKSYKIEKKKKKSYYIQIHLARLLWSAPNDTSDEFIARTEFFPTYDLPLVRRKKYSL